MKKVLSVFLALAMMFSLASFAFAADPVIKAGETKTAAFNSDDGYRFVFTAPKEGIYKLDVSSDAYGECEAYVSLEELSLTLAWSSHSRTEPDDGNSAYFPAEAGTQFTIELYMFTASEISEDVTVEVSVSECDAAVLKEGKNTGTEDDFFLFRPEKSGYWNFCSEASVNDPYIEAHDTDGMWYFNDDNGRMEDFNFDFTEYFEAGRLYMVKVSQYYDTEAVPYDFTVTFNKDIPVELLEFFYNGKLRMGKGNYEGVYLRVVPTGAIPASDVRFSVDNEKVITDIEYDRVNGNVSFRGNRIGSATITAECDGVSSQLKVVVIPRFIARIIHFFNDIINFFNGAYAR